MLGIYNYIIVNNYASNSLRYTLQEESTPIAIGIRDLHDEIIFYIIVLFIFILYVLTYLISCRHLTYKYTDFNHNTLLEIIWTISPAIILLLIGIPSLRLLYAIDKGYNPLLTLKVEGNQWYWIYELFYHNNNITFSSYPKEVVDGELRLLEVDNKVILPILTPIRILITSNDVIHSWAIPSLGIKVDAIPGRINQTYLYLLKEGNYYGQCSELCGVGHAYMPIVIEGTNMKNFINWVISSTIETSYNITTITKYLSSL